VEVNLLLVLLAGEGPVKREEGEITYWRIRAVHDLAKRVRDRPRKGQKDVELVAYGKNIGVPEKGGRG
jgi:hypothetical protein